MPRCMSCRKGNPLGQPREFVRAAAHLLYLQIRQGSLDLEQADTAYEVLPSGRGPACYVVVPEWVREWFSVYLRDTKTPC